MTEINEHRPFAAWIKKRRDWDSSLIKMIYSSHSLFVERPNKYLQTLQGAVHLHRQSIHQYLEILHYSRGKMSNLRCPEQHHMC